MHLNTLPQSVISLKNYSRGSRACMSHLHLREANQMKRLPTSAAAVVVMGITSVLAMALLSNSELSATYSFVSQLCVSKVRTFGCFC
ncbi:hypothetical protein OWV82_000170 [Melia azedarach]|uniref:Uncharacterized protein n=1 Tax=Melia azedarach TaxID=155640 RepID=A0ACC1YTF6_MELAZ|nr:hypothetical protein OWV82_000170 [Melia azedarach]